MFSGLFSQQWKGLILLPISNCSNPLPNPLGTISSAPSTIGITVTWQFPFFLFSSKVQVLIYFFIFFYFYSVVCLNGKIILDDNFFFVNEHLVLSAVRDSVIHLSAVGRFLFFVLGVFCVSGFLVLFLIFGILFRWSFFYMSRCYFCKIASKLEFRFPKGILKPRTPDFFNEIVNGFFNEIVNSFFFWGGYFV